MGHFYRHLARSLDLSFVRYHVADCYSPISRPGIDPVVFFKLQLVMFFEGVRSERRLMEVAADRLSLGWCLGYDLHEPLPDHSTPTRIRERYGLEVFRRSRPGVGKRRARLDSRRLQGCQLRADEGRRVRGSAHGAGLPRPPQ